MDHKLSADSTRSIRACSGNHGCSWTWSFVLNEDGKEYLFSELKEFLQFLPEASQHLVVAEVGEAMTAAENGRLIFYDDSYKQGPYCYRTNSSTSLSRPVGPVRQGRHTPGVFEICFEGYDYAGEGDDYRYIRIYFAEPPLDEAELLALMFAHKPKGDAARKIQNEQFFTAQTRYNNWEPC